MIHADKLVPYFTVGLRLREGEDQAGRVETWV